MENGRFAFSSLL